MKKYFSKGELKSMVGMGYKPKWVEARAIWVGKHQVIFTPEDWSGM